jgi:hypothetical protein
VRGVGADRGTAPSRDLTDDDLVNATSNVVPLSRTMKEQVDQIRRWAFGRAVRASQREAKS